MKSYYSHLQSTMEFGEKNSITKKPILRSSGVFPVIHNQNYSTSIHFFQFAKASMLVCNDKDKTKETAIPDIP